MTNERSNEHEAEIIDFRREKLLRPTKWEYCVICGQRTDVKRSEPISRRMYYVEGVGQLCPRCYRETTS